MPLTDGYLNTQPLAQIAETYQFLFSVVMFQATLYFMRLLSVQTDSTLLIGATFQAASRQLRAFALVFATLFTSFGALGMLLFGVQVLHFRTFLRALETIFCIMLGMNMCTRHMYITST